MPAAAYLFSWGIMLTLVGLAAFLFAIVTGNGWTYIMAVLLLSIGILCCVRSVHAELITFLGSRSRNSGHG